MQRILVIDDEASIRFSLQKALQRAGYEVTLASSGEEGKQLFQQNEYDLVLSDIRMPDLDGIKLLRQLHEIDPQAIVILITGYASLESAIEALRLGAFDYLLKPCSVHDVLTTVARGLSERQRQLQEARLLSRIEASIRSLHERSSLPASKPDPFPDADLLTVGDLVLNRSNHTARIGYRTISFTPKEFRLLIYMAEHVDTVLSCDELFEYLTGRPAIQVTKARSLIRHYVTNLRRKIEPDPTHPRYLITVRGIGYMLTTPPT